MSQIISALSIILICISCSRNTDEYNAPVFKETVEVALEVLNDDISFTYGAIDCIDTLLIISNKTTLNKNTFHIFSANSGKYIKSFGSVGRGPGETFFTAPDFSIDYNSRIVYVYDTNLRKLIEYSFNKIVEGDSHFWSETTMPASEKNHILTTKFYSLNNGIFLWSNNRFAIGNTSTVLSVYNEYPELDEPEEYKKVEHSYFRHLSHMSTSPDKSKFVNATYSGCILETFSIEHNNIKQIAINRFFKPLYTCSNRDANFPYLLPSDDAMGCIMIMRCTDEYIYAIYSDIPKECSYKSIAVFDWNCQPIKLLSFEDKIQYMYVLPGDKAGFALAEREDGTVYLARFEL